MSKPIDQELLPCPFCGQELKRKERKHNPYARCVTEGCKGAQLPLLNLDQPDDIAAWQARAAVQPAGVAVPEGSHFKAQVLELIGEECKYWQGRDEARRGGFAILYAKVNEIEVAAPHPVSGERVGGDPHAPAAQDVAGLAEAVRDYLSAVHEQLPNPLKVTAAMLQMKKALAAHRAQQGEPS